MAKAQKKQIRILVESSGKPGAVKVAEALVSNLPDLEVSLRSSDISNQRSVANLLEDFEEISQEIDAVIFVFTTADLLRNSDSETYSVEVDVILQMGYLLSKLGNNRVFWLTPRNRKLEIPRTLEGINFGQYDADQEPLEKAISHFSKDVFYHLDQLESEKKNKRSNHDPAIQVENIGGVLDLSYLINIHIFNNVGDTIITKETHFRSLKDRIKSRSHEAFSFSSPQQIDQLNLEAEDKDGNQLPISFTGNFKHRKAFIVELNQEIPKGTEFGYLYRYYWGGLFPKNEVNDFFFRPSAEAITINLVFPINWSLKQRSLKKVTRKLNETKEEKSTIKMAEITVAKDRLGLYKIFTIKMKGNDPLIDYARIEWQIEI